MIENIVIFMFEFLSSPSCIEMCVLSNVFNSLEAHRTTTSAFDNVMNALIVYLLRKHFLRSGTRFPKVQFRARKFTNAPLTCENMSRCVLILYAGVNTLTFLPFSSLFHV